MKHSWIVFIVAILIYSGTFHHGYVFDDHDVITGNELTHGGLSSAWKIFTTSYRGDINRGGDNLFRPLPRILFAAEWQLWPDNPLPAHVINVFLYAFLCLTIYLLLLKLNFGLEISFMSSLIFAVMPVHSEVVANIKSGDEILSMLCGIAGLFMLIKYLQHNNFVALILSVFSFFLAILSKESAVIYPLIYILALYFLRVEWKRIFKLILFYGIPVVLYLWMRNMVTEGTTHTPGILANYLAGIEDPFTRFATAIMLLGYYLLIMLVPYRLMSDGSLSEFPVVGISGWQFLFSFVVLITLLAYSFYGLRKRQPYSFALLYFFTAVSIVSNIFFLMGTNYAERLLLVPSLGICILIALWIKRLFDVIIRNASHAIRMALVSVIVIPYVLLSIVRAADWKSDLSLFVKDASVADHSARAQYYAGNQYLIEAQNSGDKEVQFEDLQLSLYYLTKAVHIYKYYDEAFYSLGLVYSSLNRPDSAEICYGKAVEIDPDNARYVNNYGDIMFRRGNIEIAKYYFIRATQLDRYDAEAFANLGLVYTNIARQWASAVNYGSPTDVEKRDAYYDSAIANLRRSVELKKDLILPLKLLREIYLARGDTSTAMNF